MHKKVLAASLALATVLLGFVLFRGRGRSSEVGQQEHVTASDSPASASRAPLPKLRPPALTARAPRFKPTYYDIFKASWKNWKKGDPMPDQFHAKEPRNPTWAAPMEKNLEARFLEDVVKKLNVPGLKVDSTDCRSSTCRVEISWDNADWEYARTLRGGELLDPMSWMTWETGPMADQEFRIPPGIGDMRVPMSWEVKRRPDGRFAVSEILIFGPTDIDPADYKEAVATTRASRTGKPNPALP